ncbi:UNVERIFIED_CONTAM: hypothetical protein Sindi_0657500 [Sesamum indicum]
MTFSNKAEFKKALQSYAIKTKRTLKFIKNDKVRLYAKCGNPDYEWTMHAIKAYRAQKAALKELEGSPQWQYNKLSNYSKEIRKTNPMSIVIVETE